eukprot:TRINITY_DN15863_c0_g1_i1.p1 TRINITY_DN15863_c0_g1~~TRINITY_DN15863_c0_g1_i1.p1  ORF type:complete len:535 (+),score=122.51 TRINITY_DN15863_c0_g1_i1:130-1734(+)
MKPPPKRNNGELARERSKKEDPITLSSTRRPSNQPPPFAGSSEGDDLEISFLDMLSELNPSDLEEKPTKASSGFHSPSPTKERAIDKAKDNTPAPPRKRVFRNLRLWIMKGENLGEEGNCFGLLKSDSDTRKTNLVPCSKPVFAQRFHYVNYGENDSIKIELWRENTSSKAKKSIKNLVSQLKGGADQNYIGFTILRLGVLRPTTSSPLEVLFPLIDQFGHAVAAAIRVKYTLVHTPFKAEEEYVEFYKLMEDPQFVSLVEEVVPAEERSFVGGCLMNIFQVRNKWKQYIDQMVQLEIDRCTEAGTLFRGNSIGVASIIHFLHKMGKPHLSETLKPPIRVILNRLATNPDTESETVIEEFLGVLFEALFNSYTNFPYPMHYIFKSLRIHANKKFGENASMRAVTGFLFLRFYVPAIRSPNELSLSDRPLNSKELSVFLSLAAIIQKISNMTLYRQGDKLYCLNKFFEQIQEETKMFIEKITLDLAAEDDLSEHGIHLLSETVCMIGCLSLCTEPLKTKSTPLSNDILALVDKLS